VSGQIAAWHAEHLNFARLLELVESVVNGAVVTRSDVEAAVASH
jgi:hypothetical protein